MVNRKIARLEGDPKLKTDVAAETRALFGDQSVVERYRRVAELLPPEAAIFSRMGREFADKRILDFGVGAGRTTPYLLEISKKYIGIDFSPAMIAACQARYPAVSFAVGDARDLSRYPAASFDFVLFSQNGIDCIDHAGRLQALAEIRRVLAPGGVFIFSSLNRDFQIPKPWNIRNLLLQSNSFANPTLLFKRLKTYAAGIYHYLRYRSQEEHTEEYALITRNTFNYGALLYAISIDAQLVQLRRVGFHEVEVVGRKRPRVLRPDEYASCGEWMLYYVCRAT